MFELVKEKLEIAVSKRTERHGDDKVNAYDAKLAGDFANNVLFKLDPNLRNTFYGPGVQADIQNDYYPELKFPLMGPVTWALELNRMRLRLHDIDSQENDLILEDKVMDKIQFSMKPGGTISLSFRVVLGQLSEDELIKLLRIDNQKISISLDQAPVGEKPDNFQQADLITQEPVSEGRAHAESFFSTPPGDDAQTPDDVVDATYTPDDHYDEPPVEAKAPAKRGTKKKVAEVE